MMAVGFLRAGPLGEGVMEAMLRSFDFAQDDTSKAAIRGIPTPFVIKAGIFAIFGPYKISKE